MQDGTHIIDNWKFCVVTLWRVLWESSWPEWLLVLGRMNLPWKRWGKKPPFGEQQCLVMSRRKFFSESEDDAISEGRCVWEHSVLCRDRWDNTGEELSGVQAEGYGCHSGYSLGQAGVAFLYASLQFLHSGHRTKFCYMCWWQKKNTDFFTFKELSLWLCLSWAFDSIILRLFIVIESSNGLSAQQLIVDISRFGQYCTIKRSVL